MYDALAVFGGGISPQGELEENSRVRVERAVELWKNKTAPTIIMSGGWSFTLSDPPTRTEARAMADYATRLGVPPEELLVEDRSRDTLGNALYVKTLFAIPRKWQKLIIVVADYHVWRTKRICTFVFGSNYDMAIVGAPLALSKEQRYERYLREHASWKVLQGLFTMPAGDHGAIEQGMMSLHPGYAKHSQISRQELSRRITERVEQLRERHQQRATEAS